MNKTSILVIVLIVGFILYIKFRPLSRIDKIDWLNVNVGNNQAWVKMNDEELNTAYKILRSVKMSIEPDPLLNEGWRIIKEKYNL